MTKLSKEQLTQIEEYVASLPESERQSKMNDIVKQFEDQPPQCPFCLMSEGKIKTTKIFEDNNFLAVLEINPINVGHTLLFPKRHIKNFVNLNNDELEKISKIIKKIDFSLLGIYGGVNIVISDGALAGQKFDHFVVNIIPRKKEDKVNMDWLGNNADEKSLQDMKIKILESFPVEIKTQESIKPDDIKNALAKKRLP